MLKKNDFIEVQYTGKVKENDMIFDTTDEAIAKEQGFHNPKMKYGSLILCIGQGQALKGLDRQLEGKEVGQTYTIEVSAEEGFGKKDPKLVQLIPTNKFKSANIKPMPGLQINVDGQIGTIKTVSGGRCMVDFNHPLTSKDLVYDLKIIQKIEDKVKQVSTLVGAMLQIEEPKVILNGDKVEVELAFELPEEAVKMIVPKILEVIKDIKEVIFKKAGSEKDNTSNEQSESSKIDNEQKKTVEENQETLVKEKVDDSN